MKSFPIAIAKNSKSRGRNLMLIALGLMGKEASSQVDMLLSIAKDENDEKGLRNLAATALGGIGEKPDVVLPILVESIRKELIDREVFVQVVGAYGPQGKKGRPEIAYLIKVIEEIPYSWTALYALAALERCIGDDLEIAALSFAKNFGKAISYDHKEASLKGLMFI